MRFPVMSVAAVAGLSLTGVLLTAGTASAAADRKSPRLANTQQTVFFHQKAGGGYVNSTPIVFTATTFTNPAFGDSGTFTNKGKKLTMVVTATTKRSGDKGCSFTAKYSKTSTYYAGKYSCPDGTADTFAVTTAGS